MGKRYAYSKVTVSAKLKYLSSSCAIVLPCVGDAVLPFLVVPRPYYFLASTTSPTEASGLCYVLLLLLLLLRLGFLLLTRVSDKEPKII